MTRIRALYYPWIQFQDERWLKNAVLFWDEISTIVPESIKDPYAGTTAGYFQEAGIVSPVFVNSFSDVVKKAGIEMLRVMDSAEGQVYLANGNRKKSIRLHPDKLYSSFRRNLAIDPEKMSMSLLYSLKKEPQDQRKKNGLSLEKNLANLYMTILANRISESNFLAPVTDTTSADSIMTQEKLYSKPYSSRKSRIEKSVRSDLSELGKSLLIEVVMEFLSIDPETPAEKIVNFRIKRADEMARFRTELNKLTDSCKRADTVEELKGQVSALFKNSIKPAFNDLKKALRSSRIEFLADSLLKTTAFSVSGTTLSSLVMGLDVQQALYAGIGASVIASSALYLQKRRRMLNENPYNYLFQLKSDL